jgi:hypothetical protein
LQKLNREELEGVTLRVYSYAVKTAKPVGPRDVTRALNLSSPSVAYRHLQKLESMELLGKNDYGEYIVKKKIGVQGYHWIGKHLIPRMILYSLFFLALLITEIVVLVRHFNVENTSFKIFFLIGGLITGVAMTIFMIEGLLQLRRDKIRTRAQSDTENQQ